MDSFALYLHESRRIFSVCPECGEVHRLSDLRLTLDEKYEKDWRDKLDDQRDGLEEKIATLGEKASALKKKAKERVERRVLPQLLRNAAPAFACKKIDARDVRTLLHPIDYVAFEGMNSSGGVRMVSLLYIGGRNEQIRTIEEAVAKRSFGWNTVRLGEDGIIQESKNDPASKGLKS